MNVRRLLRWLWLPLLLLLACVMLLQWLLRTESGRDFALARLQGQLPAGASLSWQRVDGRILDGLRFERIRYRDATQRFEAGSLEIRAALSPLLVRNLNIELLRARRVRLHLAKDDTPFEFPRWPDSLPALDLPLGVRVDSLQVSDLQLFEQDTPLYALKSVTGGFDLQPGHLRIPGLQAVSEHGLIEFQGHYRPNRQYDTALSGRVRLDTGGTPQSLRLRADGNATRFRLALDGAMPEPARLEWQLTERDGKPFWFLSASTEAFEPRRLGFVDDSVYRAQLAASGGSGHAQVAGELSRDGQTLVIEPSRIARAEGRIVLEELQLLFGGGRFRATGSFADSGDFASDGITLQVRDYPLPLADGEAGGTPVKLSGEAQWSGSLAKWQVRGDARLARAAESAKVRFQGTGGKSSAELPTLTVETAQGGLNGRLKAVWSPRLEFAFEGGLRRFDPGYFHAAFPGAVDADIQASAIGETGKDWRGALRIDRLGGSLRGRALTGKADLRFTGMAVDGEADLGIGGSRLRLKGEGGARIRVDAALQPLVLDDLHPDWRGRIEGTAHLEGDPRLPDYRVDLRGSGLSAFGYRIGALRLQGDTVTGALTVLEADELAFDGQTLQSLRAEMRGRPADAGLRVMARAGTYALDADGRLQWSETEPRVALQSVRLNGDAFGQWQLAAPMQLRFPAAGYAFSPFCLANASGSARLCAQDMGGRIALDGRDFPLVLLEPWLNNAGREFTYRGMASLTGELPKDFALAAGGFAELRVPSLGIGVKSGNGADVARLDDVRVDAEWLGRRFNGRISARLPQAGFIDGELATGFEDASPLSGKLRLQVNRLDWLELFSLDLAQPTGRIAGEVTVAGTRAEPLINGAYRLQDFSVQIPALGLKLSDGQITATSRDNLAMLVKGSIRSGEGRLTVTGVWDPADQLPQPIDLRLRGRGIDLADTPDLQLTADTDLLLGYTGGVYSLAGDIALTEGLVNLEKISTGVTVSADVTVVDPVPEKTAADLLKLGLKLQVSASDKVRVTGYGLDGTVSGKVAVNSPHDAPTRLTGTLNLGGRYAAYGQALQIKRGNIAYNNSPVYEPRLDVLTERVIEDANITVGLEITGLASRPRTRVVSNPAMSDSDALSWLLFGRPITQVSAGQANSINARSMALNAGGSVLVGTLGRQIGLDQASISDSRALGGSTLTIGKQLSPKFFVSYGVSLLGIGQVITLKYLLQKGLDITVESEQSDQREQTSAALNWRK